MKTSSLIGLASVLAILIPHPRGAEPPKRPVASEPKPGVSSVAPTTALGRPKAQANNLPILGHLETRDRLVTLYAGPAGTVYTVKTKDGRVLFDRLPASELRAKAPEVYGVLKDGLAQRPKGKAVLQDAAVRADR